MEQLESREEHCEGFTEFKHRDGLSDVEKGCVQHINSIEKQRRHRSAIGIFEEIEATTDAGEACCVLPWDLCNDVPIQTVCGNASEDLGPGQQAVRRLPMKAPGQSVAALGMDSQDD